MAKRKKDRIGSAADELERLARVLREEAMEVDGDVKKREALEPNDCECDPEWTYCVGRRGGLRRAATRAKRRSAYLRRLR